MTAMRRQLVTRDSSGRLMLVPGLIALGVLAMAVLLMSVVEYLNGKDDDSRVVLAAITIGGVSAMIALVAVAIASVRLMRSADVEGASMRAMMTATNEGVCRADQHGRLTYMNAAAERMLDRRFEDHAGGSLAAVFPLRHRIGGPEDQGSPLFSGVLAGGSYAGRDLVVRGDGTILSVDVRVARIVLNGEPAGAVLAFSDDTERSREDRAQA